MNSIFQCLMCGGEKSIIEHKFVCEQVIKGETLEIETPATRCVKCRRVTLEDGQVDELRFRTADVYRKKHGLLTGDTLRAMRELLNMNQIEFAEFLSVGTASVKRWETWLIQDRSSDELIRLKFDKAMKRQAVKETEK